MTFERHTVDDFLKYDAATLRQKRLFVNFCVKAAKECQEEGDPRAEKALEYYKNERKAINGALQQLLYGDEGPPAQTVKLKPATMQGQWKPTESKGKRPGAGDETWGEITELAKQFVQKLMEVDDDGRR
jgi:hypothetical protein